MAGQSVGNLNVKITGDASNVVAELKRADDAVRNRAASMSGQMEKLQGDLSKNFSFAKFGKDILGGFGIGSAAGLTMTLIDHFVDMWRESEQYAAKLEERAQNIAEAMRRSTKDWAQMTRASMSPEDQQLAAVKSVASLAEQLDAAEADRQKAIRGMGFAADAERQGFGIRIKEFEGEKFVAPGSKDGLGMQAREFGDEMQKRADEAQKRGIEIRDQMRARAEDLMRLNKDITDRAARDAAVQEEARQKEILLNSGPDMSRARFEITDADRRRSEDAARKFETERIQGLTSEIARLTSFSGTRVDDMTRRGLGSGGNYLEIQKQANDYLAEMARTLREIREQGPLAGYAN